jgi:LacI family transcriptional regulator
VTTPVTTTRRRLTGYRSAIAENGLDTGPELICMPGESADEAAAELVKRLDAPNAPTAVFSSNIPCTMALVRALKQAERTDIALIGFGDFPMAAALTPAVTVVDQDPSRLGHIAVERLLQRIEDPLSEPRRRTVLPVRLIPRGSGELRPRPTKTRPTPRHD